jgi:putative transposase
MIGRRPPASLLPPARFPSPKAEHEADAPASFSDASNDDHRRRVRKAVRERLEERELTRERPLLGQSPFDQPTPKPPARTLDPRLAHRGQDKWRRIELLQALTSLPKSDSEAWQRWPKGLRDLLFPAGTYRMRELCAVRCGPAPPLRTPRPLSRPRLPTEPLESALKRASLPVSDRAREASGTACATLCLCAKPRPD